MLKYLKKIRGIGCFKAPNVNIHPILIKPNTEYLEVLTDGCILFPDPNGDLKEYRRGTVFWHVSGEATIHRTLPNELYECLVLNFEVSRPMRPGPRISQWRSADETINFANNALRLFHTTPENLQSFAEYVYAVFAWNAVSGNILEQKLPNKLAPVPAFIRKNLGSDISSEDMAKYCGISLPYFFSLFREYFGTTPHQYLLKERIGKAKALLAGTQTSIKEIALLCGFESTEVFYRRFKIETGFTPNNYRKKYERKN